MRVSGMEFEVKLQGRSRLIYAEADRKITIGVELEVGDFDFVVYLSEVQSWDGSGSPKISPEKKDRIKANIDKELQKSGLKIEWG